MQPPRPPPFEGGEAVWSGACPDGLGHGEGDGVHLTRSLLRHCAKGFLSGDASTSTAATAAAPPPHPGDCEIGTPDPTPPCAEALRNLLHANCDYIDDPPPPQSDLPEAPAASTVTKAESGLQAWRRAGHDSSPLSAIAHADNSLRVAKRNQRLHETICREHSHAAASLQRREYGVVAAAAAVPSMTQMVHNLAEGIRLSVSGPRVDCKGDATPGQNTQNQQQQGLASRTTPFKMVENIEPSPCVKLRPGMAALVMSYSPAALPPDALLGTGERGGGSSGKRSAGSAPSVTAIHSTLHCAQLFPHGSQRNDFLLVLRPSKSQPGGRIDRCVATLRKLPGTVWVSGHQQPRRALPPPLSPELHEGLKARVSALLTERLIPVEKGEVVHKVVPKDVVNYLFTGGEYDGTTSSRWFWEAKKAALKSILDEHFTPTFAVKNMRGTGDIAEAAVHKTFERLPGWSLDGFFASAYFVGVGGGAAAAAAPTATPELVCLTEGAARCLSAAAPAPGVAAHPLLETRHVVSAHYLLPGAHPSQLPASAVVPSPRRRRTPTPPPPSTPVARQPDQLLRRLLAAMRVVGSSGDPALAAAANKLMRVAAAQGWAHSKGFCAASGGGAADLPPCLDLARITLKSKELFKYLHPGVGFYSGLLGGGDREGGELLALFFTADEINAFTPKQRAAALEPIRATLSEVEAAAREANVFPKHGDYLRRMFEREAVLLGASGVPLAEALSHVSREWDPFVAKVKAVPQGGGERFVVEKVLPSGIQLAHDVVKESRKTLLVVYSALFGERPAKASNPKPKPQPKPEGKDEAKTKTKAASKPAGRKKAAAKPAAKSAKATKPAAKPSRSRRR